MNGRRTPFWLLVLGLSLPVLYQNFNSVEKYNVFYHKVLVMPASLEKAGSEPAGNCNPDDLRTVTFNLVGLAAGDYVNIMYTDSMPSEKRVVENVQLPYVVGGCAGNPQGPQIQICPDDSIKYLDIQVTSANGLAGSSTTPIRSNCQVAARALNIEMRESIQ